MIKYRVVKATQDRMWEVARVFRESFRDIYPNFPPLHSLVEDLMYFTNTMFPNNDVYVAEDLKGEKIFGFIAFRGESVAHLYVLPGMQGHGIGSALLAIAKHQAERLLLWTFQQNRRARTFYKKHGFEEIKLTDGSSTEEKHPDVQLEWKLTVA